LTANKPQQTTAVPCTEISVVVPVYQGEHTLQALVDEVIPFTAQTLSPDGRPFRVVELLLVHDGGPDASAKVMRELAVQHPFVRLVWLSRNFGQHAATLAGMASTVCEWVVTMDEDGQHNPADVGRLFDTALNRPTRLVYATAANKPPHGFVRNLFSKIAKTIFLKALGTHDVAFNSFRMIQGEVARGVAAYCGANTYLDVALSWVVGHTETCKVQLREERGRRSGYSPARLFRHFWQLVLSSGTLPLRLLALFGATSIVVSLGSSAYLIWRRLEHKVPVQGWTSTAVLVALFAGATLVSLGIIAEYLGFAVSMAQGKPPYLIVGGPREDIGRKP
jgi:polyisoprenyl-phosphate glycosyltransferase